MPSRVSYEVSTQDGDRPLDPEGLEDSIDILIAAQLSRVICRGIEVAAFQALQKRVNNIPKGSNADQGSKELVRDLGQILIRLRWRVVWWEVFGDGSESYDEAKEIFIDRVRTLIQTLYFYYFAAQKRLPPWLNSDDVSLSGSWSTYPDADQIYEEFPREESIEGLNRWMESGQHLIQEAGVQRRLDSHKQVNVAIMSRP